MQEQTNMSQQEENQTRRGFLENIVKVGVGAVAATAVLSNPVLAIYDNKKNVITKVNISEHKKLAKVGGSILVKDTSAGDILIVRLEGNKFAVMSNICPHKKCEVKVRKNDYIQCPCHKSKYALDGTYTYGPAKKDLTRFPFEVSDGTITVTKK